MQDFDGVSNGEGSPKPFLIKVTEIGAVEKRSLDVAQILRISPREEGGSIIRHYTTPIARSLSEFDDDQKGNYEDIEVVETPKHLIDMINGEPSATDIAAWETDLERRRAEITRQETADQQQREQQAQKERAENYDRSLDAKRARSDSLQAQEQGLAQQIASSPKLQKAYDIFDRAHGERNAYGLRSRKSSDGLFKGRPVRQWDKMMEQHHRGRFPELALIITFDKTQKERHLNLQGIKDMIAGRERNIGERDMTHRVNRLFMKRQLTSPYLTRDDKAALQRKIDGYKKEHGAPEEFRFRAIRPRTNVYENTAYNERLRLERIKELENPARIRRIGLRRSR